MAFLDKTGLSRLWTNILALVDTKVPNTRTVNGKALSTDITLSASDVGAAPSSHSHDDLYYTETEIDTKLAAKSDTTHNHDSSYDVKGSADDALATAKSYTDTKTSTLASTTVVDNKISTHNISTSAHNDIRELISGLTTRLNTLADSDDTTLDQMSEIVAYIKSNKDLIDAITTSKVNVSDIIDNLTTNVTNKPLSAAQGVVLKGLIDNLQTVVDGKAASEHTHAIADVTNLQTTLNDKVSTSRTINGKALGADITLSASDVNAYTKTEIDEMTFVTIDDIDTICGGAIQAATLNDEVTF